MTEEQLKQIEHDMDRDGVEGLTIYEVEALIAEVRRLQQAELTGCEWPVQTQAPLPDVRPPSLASWLDYAIRVETQRNEARAEVRRLQEEVVEVKADRDARRERKIGMLACEQRESCLREAIRQALHSGQVGDVAAAILLKALERP